MAASAGGPHCPPHRWGGGSACLDCGWTKGRDVRRRAHDLAYAEGYAAAAAGAGRLLREGIEAIDHPCHEACVGNLHADCQCAAWVRQEALAALDAGPGQPT